MITNPARQHDLRTPRIPGHIPRAVNTAHHQAVLARRLTGRDRWLLRMLHEHRILTSRQITRAAFPSARSGRQRLHELFSWSVVDRFQPLVARGSAPLHYVLGPAGATVLAAETGHEVSELGYRHQRAMAIAHSLRLAHTVGINDWFTTLIAHARQDPSITVNAWWSETRCAHYFGDLVRPDAYGRISSNGDQFEFFLEYDCGTEALAVLADKLAGYAALAHATGIVTPLLIWLPTTGRETNARPALTQAWQALQDPDSVPIATAAADQLNPTSPNPSPADQVWLPLSTAGSGMRLRLQQLGQAWPQAPSPIAGSDSLSLPETPASKGRHVILSPPNPMPPTSRA